MKIRTSERRFRRRLGISAATGAAIAALSATFIPAVTTSSATSVTPITMLYSAVSGPEIPLFVALGENIFQKYGLQVNLVLVNAAVTPSALAQNQGQIGVTASSAFEAEYQGAGMTVIGDIGPSAESFIVQSSVKSFNDLRGKSIAVTTPGTTGDLITKELMALHGLHQPQDYTIDYVGSAAALVSSMAKNLVAAVGLQPPLNYSVYAQDPGSHNLVQVGDTRFKLLTTNFLAANKGWAQAHKSLLRDFEKAWNAAIQFAKNKPTAAIQQLTTQAKIPQSYAHNWYNRQLHLLAIEPVSKKTFTQNITALNGTYPGIDSVPESQLVDNLFSATQTTK